MTMVFSGLEDSFDNESAERMLNLSIGKITRTADLVRKSMYDFDLDTPEGIEKLMSLLPIMDPEILKDIIAEIWPGYPAELDPRRHRMEIKGYCLDFVASYNAENTTNTEEAPALPVDSGSDATSTPAEAPSTEQGAT